MVRLFRLPCALIIGAVVLVSSLTAVRASSPTNPVPAGWPKVVIIPRLHITAPVEALPLNSAAQDMAPFKWGDVVWYDRGPRPGDLGRATVFGHLDSYCCPAAFYELRLLKPGDTVQVQYRGGRMLRFRVMWQQSYLNAKVPISWMFGRAHERGLSLVTCTGIFHRGAGGYDHKLLVYARLVLPSGQLG